MRVCLCLIPGFCTRKKNDFIKIRVLFEIKQNRLEIDCFCGGIFKFQKSWREDVSAVCCGMRHKNFIEMPLVNE